MKLLHFEKGIMRTPSFSQDDEVTDIWEELKNKIKYASPEFHKIIKEMTYPTLNEAPEKVRFTVWKYFNRSQYRATPFGDLAAFSILKFDKSNNDLIRIDRKILNHNFVDWSLKDSTSNSKGVSLSNDLILMSNSTLYHVDYEYRYIIFSDNGFRASTVNIFPELLAILDLCYKKISYYNLKNLIQNDFNINEKAIESLIANMIECQILFTDNQPNITGPDYFERVEDSNQFGDLEYIISERKILSGTFNSSTLKHLPELIDFICKHIKKDESSDLEVFKIDFLKKFGDKEVPLCEAIDPEVGIGYGGLEQFGQENELFESLMFSNEARDKRTIAYTPLHAYLINNLKVDDFIQLANFIDDKNTSSYCLPNSFNIIYRLYEGKLAILSAGGTTATALLGRFTLAGQEVENLTKLIVEIEVNSNPGVIFFDVSYQAEKHVDNINRRKNLYYHELPILTWSCLPEPLIVNDILVSVRKSEIVLRSKTSGKRMVPRVASAYNYSRSDLSVYRFLCDLQHQNLKTDLTFDLQEFFPDLNHYPRVIFKDIIVSPAKWKLPYELINHIKANNIHSSQIKLQIWLEEKNIDFTFRSGPGDKKLYFDPKSDTDRWAFILFVRQQNDQDLYIAEALISKNSNVKDQYGLNYLAEFVVNYYHEQTIYPSIPPNTLLTSKLTDTKRIMLPGGEWLYYEIYCSPLRASEILIDYFSPFFKNNMKYLCSWFFIRYDDPSPHLRIRMKLKDSNNFQHLVHEISVLLEKKVKTGVVSTIEIKSYTPEIERYGANRIHLIETYFHLNSVYILKLISRTNHTEQIYATTLSFFGDVLSACFRSIDEQISFVKMMANNFAREMNINSTTFKQLNVTFKLTYPNLEKFTMLSLSRQNKMQKKILSKILIGCNLESKDTLLGDLIHMHVNRLFSTDQRIHEMILYQHLTKILLIKRAKQGG